MTAQNMLIVGDGHLHWYPFYDSAKAIESLIHNLDALREETNSKNLSSLNIGFLVERAGQNFFDRLISNEIKSPVPGLKIEPGGDNTSVMFTQDGVIRLCLIAGRQIVTSERIEILEIGTRKQPADGQPVKVVLKQIMEREGIPILPWGAGKWLFKRGALIKEIIKNAKNTELFIGDSSLRPLLLDEPHQMLLARAKGLTVIPGSDPLPTAGEETIMGTYAFIYEGMFDTQQPVLSFRKILSDRSFEIKPAGRRNTLTTTISRLIRFHTKKQG